MDEKHGVCDGMVAIQANDVAIQDVPCDPGRTGASLPVKNQGGLGYECSVTPGTGTAEVLGFVDGGMRVQVGCGSEVSVADFAIVVGLAHMLFVPCRISKCLEEKTISKIVI